MLGQYAREEEVHVPVSDWGRWRKDENRKYLEEQRQKAELAKLAPKNPVDEESRKARMNRRRDQKRAGYQSRIIRHCACGARMYANNKHETCNGCTTKAGRRALKLGPRPICPGCGGKMNRTNTIGACRKCANNPYRMTQNFGPRPVCRECSTVLNRGNASGLCEKHRKAEYYRAKKASKNAA